MTKQTDILRLVRPNIRALVPYSSARDEYTGEGAVLLDANENPYNAPYNRYPDPRQRKLRERIATLKGIRSDQVFAGNGSDEAIDLLFRIFCEPGRHNAVSIYPTYGMYAVCADIHNVELRRASLKADFGLDAGAIGQAVDGDTRLLFICSPNNPTSNSFDPSEIAALAEQYNLMVVVDEAYIDFSSRQSLKDKVNELPNLVVLQTFSKAWGLAGIRLGIAIAHPAVVQLFNKVKYPYNLNSLTQAFALKALTDVSRKDEWVRQILGERRRLERMLGKYRFVTRIYPSDANFLLVQVKKPLEVFRFLAEKKIIVRDRSRVELCDDSLRITVGTPEENRLLGEALMEYQRLFVESCEI